MLLTWQSVQARGGTVCDPVSGKPGGGVIELAVGPLDGVVALSQVVGKPVCGTGVCRVVVVGLVARDASRDRDVVVVVDVAVGALAAAARCGEPVSGKPVLCVIELRVQSTSMVSWHGSQVCGKFAVTWFGIRRALVILQVAGDAGRACSGCSCC